MKEQKSSFSLAAVLAAFAIGFVVALGITMATRANTGDKEEPKPIAEQLQEESEKVEYRATDPALDFPSWNADSKTLQKLISFVEDACNESSASYVEPKDRIATFDMDGTIVCEKAPVYIDYCLLMHRVLEDKDYKPDAKLTETCKKLRANADKGVVDSALDEAKGKAFAQAFEGMTSEDFGTYTNNFLDTVAAEGFEGMTYGESFYKPMVEVITYLRAHDFDVYIVSACEREVVRAAVGPRLGVAPDHIIGSDMEFEATAQGETPANEYTMTQDDELTLGGELISDCGKGNKVVYIQREIGKNPILSFGNSSGDFAMLNYAQSNDEHPGMGVLIVADDTEREYGDEEKSKSMKDEAGKEGWLAVSMRDDWATIYGESVEKTALKADQKQEQKEEQKQAA